MFGVDNFFNDRMEICKKCPLYKVDQFYGPICDSGKYIKEDGSEWSYSKKPGFVKGCGCHLKQKAKNKIAHCIIGKW